MMSIKSQIPQRIKTNKVIRHIIRIINIFCSWKGATCRFEFSLAMISLLGLGRKKNELIFNEYKKDFVSDIIFKTQYVMRKEWPEISNDK